MMTQQNDRKQNTISSGLQSSPWLIIGATIIILTIVLVQAIGNFKREREHMYRVLSTKGAVLIRTVEAGSRTGMMGMSWGSKQVQSFLEETAKLPEVLFLAVINKNGDVLAHSDPAKIGKPFRKTGKLVHLGPDQLENNELVDTPDGDQVFEVHRYFQPLEIDQADGAAQMQNSRHHHMMMRQADDWFDPLKRQHYIIVVGLSVTQFQETIRGDIRNTLLLSVVLLLLGFAGMVALFLMQNYLSAKRSLQDTSVLADEIVAHLPVGLMATDRSGRIQFFNAAAERILGVPYNSAIGKTADLVLPYQLYGLLEQLSHSRVISEKEIDCYFSGNRLVPLSVSGTRITNKTEQLVADVIILKDLGEIRRLQEEIRRKEKLAALGSLAAGVAHEIRNPLSSVKGLASYFAGKFDRESEDHEVARVIVEETERLNRAISDLLEFAKPSDLKRRHTDLEPVLSHSLGLIQQDVQAKKIQIKINVAKGLCRPFIDPDRLSQCLLNIYLNALQVMSEGGILGVAAMNFSQDQLCIEISDTGPGIPAEKVEDIFNPYYTTKPKGTGLGLAIVHKIITAHGGKIFIESPSGGGTRFKILLPCRSERGEYEKE